MSAINFYKIVCNNTGTIYVGSTCKTIAQRLQQHENNYIRYLNGGYHFVSSYIVLENKNYSIELIDSVVCTDKKHRNTLERIYILNNGCINRNQPGRDKKQYYQDNKEQLKEYREDNKEKINEYAKQYGVDNKEKIREYKKQYYQDKKEKMNEYTKQYRENNKAKINEKINCPCSGKYTFTNKTKHLKTKLHIAYLATL